jgi:sigma-B regulation protein RsbU (phosphoserine phosphatase)
MTMAWEAGVGDPARLAALERSLLAGTGSEDAFDRLLELSVDVTGAPRGVITLVDAERTTAKSAIGFPEGSSLSAPIEQSFCRFVVGSGRPLTVDDARHDPRTRGDPAIEAFDAGAWAGYPIEDGDGAVLGTFCVMDPHPHEWSTRDLKVIATLAKAASSEIALRRARHRGPERDPCQSVSSRDRATLVTNLAELVAHSELSGAAGRDLLAWIECPPTPD